MDIYELEYFFNIVLEIALQKIYGALLYILDAKLLSKLLCLSTKVENSNFFINFSINLNHLQI